LLKKNEFPLITGSVCVFALFCAVAAIVALIFVYPHAVCHNNEFLSLNMKLTAVLFHHLKNVGGGERFTDAAEVV
jgi:hypothetical protein